MEAKVNRKSARARFSRLLPYLGADMYNSAISSLIPLKVDRSGLDPGGPLPPVNSRHPRQMSTRQVGPVCMW